MSRTRFPRRCAGAILLNAILTSVGLGTLAWGTASFMAPSTSTTLAKPVKARSPDPLSNQELAVALTRVGLSADRVAAAGLISQEVTALVGRAREHLGANIQGLRDADTAWGTTRNEVDRLERLVRGGQREQLAALDTARTAFTSADSSRRAIVEGVFDAATDGLAPVKLAAVTAIRAGTVWDMPTQYLAVGHAERDWVQLRDALANDRISRAAGEEPDPASHQLLLTFQADPAVSAAATNLESLPTIQAAWNASVFP